MGFFHRAGVRGAVGLDAPVRARRDLPPRDPGPRLRHRDRGDQAAAGPGQGAGPVGVPPSPRARGRGVRPGQARPHARDPRPDPVRPGGVRQQRPRLGQRRAAGHRHRVLGPGGAARAVAAAPAGRAHAQRVLDDRARGRRRPDHDHHHRGAGRGRVGDRRPQVVHQQRLGGRLPHRDGGDQPRRPPLPGVLDDRRPGRHPGGRHRPRRGHHGGSGRALREVRRPRRDPLPRGAGALREPGRARGRRIPPGPEAAGPGPHPSLHALAGPVQAGLRHAVRAGGVPHHPPLAPGREADHPELGGRLAGRDDRGPAA